LPYIRKADRKLLTPHFNVYPKTPGELNFTLTETCLLYLEKGHSYTNFNEVIGALEAAKLELYRRLVVPYEDEKIKQNGDVYAEDGGLSAAS
jgi:hypothetical protein